MEIATSRGPKCMSPYSYTKRLESPRFRFSRLLLVVPRSAPVAETCVLPQQLRTFVLLLLRGFGLGTGVSNCRAVCKKNRKKEADMELRCVLGIGFETACCRGP